MRPGAWLALLCAGTLACSKPNEPGAATEPASSIAASSASTPPSTEPTQPATADAAHTDVTTVERLQDWQGFTPIKGKSVGHTSLVIRFDDAQGRRAAFRPTFRAGGRRYRGEIAAFRLAQALGLEAQVPAAFAFQMGAATLRAGLDDEKMQEALAEPGGGYRGALVPWIHGLELPPFEREPWVSRWKGWLADGPLPSGADLELAAQFSALVMFDHVTGNFDRWSGGNLGSVANADGSPSLRFIDNDGAFLDPVPQKTLKNSRERLLACRRYSRRTAQALTRLLERDDWTSVFGDELPGKPLLDAKVVAEVRARAVEVQQHLTSLGEAGAILP